VRAKKCCTSIRHHQTHNLVNVRIQSVVESVGFHTEHVKVIPLEIKGSQNRQFPTFQIQYQEIDAMDSKFIKNGL